jgi:hypothetical protein
MERCERLREELVLALSPLVDDATAPSRGWFARLVNLLAGVVL